MTKTVSLVRVYYHFPNCEKSTHHISFSTQVPRPMYLVDKSALHYAVTSGLVPMVEMLLDEGYQEAINKNDIITGFTPFHLALFTQNLQMMFLLLRRGARVDIKFVIIAFYQLCCCNF